ATITPASGFVGIQGAIILGLSGGILCYIAVDLIRIKLKIDDSLDVFAVHGVGGILGSVLLPVMAMPVLGGFGAMDNILGDVGVQAYAVMVTIIWTGIFSFGILYVIRLVMPLRVHEEDEFEGLDITQHGERGYHGG
ncbi:MAG TPA: ammonia channel protein, partial [Alphaproteobacteria bacterium]|nr:ammonia channel protein [Alphaproteobacteria bacterium]